MLEPITVTIRSATERTGISRASLYRLAISGDILFRKMGRTTLVDWASLKAYAENLPVAELRGPCGE